MARLRFLAALLVMSAMAFSLIVPVGAEEGGGVAPIEWSTTGEPREPVPEILPQRASVDRAIQQVSEGALANSAAILIEQRDGAYYSTTGGYSQFVDLLDAGGYAVSTITTGSLTNTMLMEYDVFIAMTCRAYTSAEIAALHIFVDNGGGLFVIADHSSDFSDPVQSLTEAFGVHLDANVVHDTDDYISPYDYWVTYGTANFAEHPITSGLSKIQSFCAASMTGGNAIAIVKTDADGTATPSDSPVVRATHHGDGRVVVIADLDCFANDYGFNIATYPSDNKQFALNIVNWLSNSIRFPVDNPTDGVVWHHYPGSSGHGPSLGIGGADDTYALDLNWKSGDADLGKPVYAIQDGVVEQVDKRWGWVLIKHDTVLEWRGQTYQTWYSGYAHMRNIPKSVAPGANIEISTQIGEVAGVGKGTSFSPHLHFAIYVGSTQEKAPVNAFLESLDAGQVAGPEYAAYTYGDLETTYDWGFGAIYNHNVDESTGQDASHWFERGGSESDWSGTDAYGFYDYMFFTHTEKSNTDDWGRWNHILLADGEFTIMAFVPRNYGTARLATYTVSLNGTFIFSATVSQNSYCDKWVTLGTMNGKTGDRLSVYLADNTGEKNKYLAYDAIKILMKQDLALPRS